MTGLHSSTGLTAISVNWLTLASKDASRAEAIRRWPAQAELFARKKDDGRAEAALIAIAGMTRQGDAR